MIEKNGPWRLLGQSAAIRGVVAELARLAPSLRPAHRVPPILLQGETGTGKGLFARTIHEASPRASGPFIDLNCAAIPSTLIEAELFGFERGAFTDARQARTGLVQAAHSGVLFLDEIGLLPRDLQAKLLTVLETREVRPLGGLRTQPVDVLIIAATNTDLPTAVRDGAFREDLYHRLAVLVFSLPPLRDRGEDILEMAHVFLARACADHGLAPKTLTEDARAALLRHPWPGNVRELGNLMERIALLTPEERITANGLGLPAPHGPGGARVLEAETGQPLKDSIDTFARTRVEEALRQARGNVSAAADRLGVPRSTLRYQVERLGLKPAAARLGRPRAARALVAAGPTPSPTTGSERIPPFSDRLEGERKQVTVLFAELKGSPDLLTDHDPEESLKLLDPVLERMIGAVQRYDGTILQVRVGGIMALFGAPVAHEDHAVRACYAALSMRDAIARDGEELERTQGGEDKIRIGLNSGDVAVRSIGSDLYLEYAAFPQTTHVAARLEQEARPGTTLMTAETLRLAEGFVEVVPAGSADVYELCAPSAARSRLAVAVTRGLTRFVGRDAETMQIRVAMDQARDGRGQVVALVGEPGVGKSRLTWEVARSARAQSWLVLETGSVSASKAPPYLPLADLLRGYFEIEAGALPARIHERVSDKLLALDVGLRPLSSPLLAILDVPVDDADWERHDARERRRRMFDAARRLILAASQRAPVLVVVDDLHWIDSETQAFLDLVVESLAGARVLLLVNYRPEGEHAWGGKTYYTQVRVDTLPLPSAGELLDALVGTEPALDAVKRLLVERTEGNPFFIEESVQTLAETGALVGKRGRYQAGRMVSTIQVPARVESILTARIDRLPHDDKRLLQAAAVIGTDVPLGLLRLIADFGDDELAQGLASLQSAEFLYEVRRYPEVEYTFKHALTHDVAYGSLLESPRRKLHERIAKALEEGPAPTREAQPELLAHHFTAAGLAEPSATYWLRAAELARKRSAYPEAVRYARQGLETGSARPDTAEGDRRELDLLIALFTALQALKGLAAAELEPVLQRARELCDRVGTAYHRRRVIAGGQFMFWNAVPDLARALDLGREFQATSPPALQVYAMSVLAQTLRNVGHFEEALVHAESGIELYDRAAHEPRTSGTLLDIGTGMLSDAAHALWALGYPDRARARLQEMLAHARRLEHPLSLAWACVSAVRHLWIWREDDEAEEQLDQGVKIAAEYGFPLLLSFGTIDRGWLLVRRGRVAEGIALLREGLEQQLATGVKLTRVPHLGLLAEAYGYAGSPEKGLGALDEAFALMERGGERQFESTLHCVRGGLLVTLGTDARGAEASMLRALEVARAQRAKSLELRAALSLARLWLRQGRRHDTRVLVAGIHAHFTEGFDTPDLRDAKALLAELAGQ
jgi:DNA-binding NtrC family response regulator/class 3 adenylate cyclase/predicted ATPase